MKESVSEGSDKRKQEDLKFFDNFCKKGFQSEHSFTVLKAIRLGKSNTATEPIDRPRLLKLVFKKR